MSEFTWQTVAAHTLFLDPPFLLVTAVLGLTLLAPSGDVMYCVRGVGTT